MKQVNRPLSFHLSMYKSQQTSLLSIFHRISGFVLSFIFLIFNLYYIFVNSFVTFNWFYFLHNVFFNIIWVLFLMFLFTFFFHILNGFRHLSWDLCHNLELNSVTNTAFFVLFFTFFSILILIFI
jgi:succinate dehydrogenase / fumarate reductase cytochrome b subunit